MVFFNATSYTEGINNFIPGSENVVDFVINYLFSLPFLVTQKDYFAIMVSLILIYLIVSLINKISTIFLLVAKKGISFIITILALFLIYSKFMENLSLEGFSTNTIIIGLVGILTAILGTIISFYSVFSHTKSAISHRREGGLAEPEDFIEDKPELDLNHMKDFKTFFSLDSLKNDKSLLSVLTFLVVAEFGVFSTKTISAPNAASGLIILLIFLVLSFAFIKQSYNEYRRGLTHIIITFTLGSILAIFLGHYWEGIPFSTLFSLELFTTDVIVALMSGMALSLFAGSRK